MIYRHQVVSALDAIVHREDGISFQRLARSLLRTATGYLIPHAEHADLGRDATMVRDGKPSCMCASLDCSWTKIRTDLKRVTSESPDIKNIVFCTPKTVSNKRIAKLAIDAKRDFTVDLQVLERTWVIDECMREENEYLARDVLGIFQLPSGSNSELVIGDIVTFGTSYEEIPSLDVACGSGASYCSWSTAPQGDADESVYVSRIYPSVIAPRRVATGADPAIAVSGNRVFIAWIRHTGNEDERTIFTSEYDLELNHKRDHLSAGGARRLACRPMLLATGGTVYLMLVEKGKQRGGGIRVLNLQTGRETTTELNGKVVHAACRQTNDSVVCVADTDTSLEFLSLEDSGFRHLCCVHAKDFGATNTGLWDFVVRNGMATIVMDVMMSRWSMFSTTVDIQTGQRGDIWPIAHWGKFPSIDLLPNGTCVAAWVGSPPIPLELQREGELPTGTSMDLHARADEQVRRGAE